ncbi:hypothetical protein ENSA5_68870 [Enhygromyxa salina]|uniref:Uncharacterized protein n=1 Tax=Enhygromyxa salina TaxID=215803 RepID=A0A2S9XAX4_9BACT|nr:hypothetical protein [Enhygromyxa salina]PRP90005.1 hypothetical protein ENSA5_68870 [Enhygromyxa salina]
MLLYDNGVGNPDVAAAAVHSRTIRYTPDFDAMTATQAWADDDPQLRSPVAGDADRSAGGHVLRLDSTWVDADNPAAGARLRELDPARSPNAVWTLYMPPGKFSHRAAPISRFVGVPE